MKQISRLISVATCTMLAACAGCSLPGWMTAENVSPEPKVKYDATWWSDRSEKNVRDEILQRRKELIEQRAREIEALEQQPPLNYGQSAHGPPSEIHVISRIPRIDVEPAVEFQPAAPGRVQVAQFIEPLQPADELRSANEVKSSYLKIGTDDRIATAVKMRAIIEDGQGDSIALLVISERRTVHVRAGDAIDIESAGRVVQARVERITRDTVYIRTSDNPDIMVAVR